MKPGIKPTIGVLQSAAESPEAFAERQAELTRKFSVAFGDSKGLRSRWVVLNVLPTYTLSDHRVPRVTPLEVVLLSGGALGVTPSISVVDSSHLKLCLTIDPGSVDYSQLDTPRHFQDRVVVQTAGGDGLDSYPVELAFRQSKWTAGGIAVAGVLFGLLVKVLSEAEAGRRAKHVGTKKALKTYFSELTFPIALILAVVGGFFILLEMYFGENEWGSLGDAKKLFAVCFLAQMSSVASIDIFKRVASAGGAPTGQGPDD